MSDMYVSPEDYAKFLDAMKAEEQAKQAALSPKDFDRWDTIPGAMKITSENTPEQQRLVDQINRERAAKWIKEHGSSEGK